MELAGNYLGNTGNRITGFYHKYFYNIFLFRRMMEMMHFSLGHFTMVLWLLILGAFLAVIPEKV